MRPCQLLLVTIAATVGLGVFVNGTSARILTFSNQSFRSQFRQVVFSGGFGNFSCALTLEGSLHARTLAKVANDLIGYITRAGLGPCIEGTATILRETLPWHVQYASFEGTLPNITRIGINILTFSVRFRESVFGVECLERSEAARPLAGGFTRSISLREITGLELRGRIPTSCGVDATVEADREPVTLLNSTTKITVTLI